MNWLEAFLYGAFSLGGVALGSYLTTHGLIKSKEADLTLEMFKEVLDKVYSPIDVSALKILSANQIIPDDSRQLKDIIDNNRNIILLCPDKIQEHIYDLRKSLKDEEYKEAIDRLEALHQEIKEITSAFSLSNKSLCYPMQIIKGSLKGLIQRLRGENNA